MTYIRHRATVLVALLTAAVVGVAAAPARADDGVVELDLETCVAQASANSDLIYAARFRQEAAEARAGGAQASRWPTLSTVGSYDYASEVTSFDVPIGPTPRTIEFGDGNTWRFGVGVDVPLYTGGSLGANAHAERAGAGAAEYDVAADSLSVVRGTRAAFYRALASGARLDAARVAVRRLERHLERVNQSIDVGAASEEERVQITARLREAEQRMLAVEMEKVTDELALGTAIGRPGVRVTPRGDLDASLMAGPPAGDTFESRPELWALAMRRRESDERARAAWGSLLPSVVASAYMNYGRPGVDPVENDWMSWASARVSLSWTLFDAGARSKRTEAARASARAIDATRSDLHRRLEGAFTAAQVRLDYAQRQAGKAVERLDAERRRLELVTGRRDQGMATETELLDAHDDLADAEASEVSARAAVRLAESELLYAAGR
jgi:outer membrane protein